MTAESTSTTLAFPPDLVPELHALILSNIPYFDLLCVKRVAKKWKAIIESDPALQVQTFKKATSVYRDNGVVERYNANTVQEESEPVTMHPALQRMDMRFGDPISEMKLFYDDDTLTMASAGVLDDLATIPAVHTFKSALHDDEISMEAFSINVKNNKGITVLDVLNGIVQEAEKLVYSSEHGKMVPRHWVMSDSYYYYNGFGSLKRTGTKLFALIGLEG